MVYMATLPGGWIADRLIGQQRAVLYGGIIIALATSAWRSRPSRRSISVCCLIVIGTGLLKGNVSVIVGQLYSADDERRDAGFSIFYMGINLGAFIAPLVCGYLGQRVNWHLGFGAAGIGMTLGIVQYVLGGKYLGSAGLPPDSSSQNATLKARARFWSLIATTALVAFGLAAYTGILPITATQVADAAGYMLIILTVVFFGWLFFASDWTREERTRLYVIGVLFVAAALFWSLFEQAGSTLNLFADRDTSTSVFGWNFPSTYFQSLNSAFIWIFAPLIAWLWLALGPRQPSTIVKFALGEILVGAGFGVLVIASTLASTGVQVSPMWLTVTYLLHTFGELCLSPVGLSAMTKLAPARIAGLIMGVWFLASSVGNFIAGRLAGFYESMPLPELFGVVAVFGIAAGVVLLALARPMSRLTGSR